MSHTHILKMTRDTRSHADVYADALLKTAQAKKLMHLRKLVVTVVSAVGLFGLIMQLNVVERFFWDVCVRIVWRGIWHSMFSG